MISFSLLRPFLRARHLSRPLLNLRIGISTPKIIVPKIAANFGQIQQLATKSVFGRSGSPSKIVGLWLLGTAGMVWVAVTLGGVTRLTESGLSMVDWRLIRGMRPPLTEEDWRTEFDKYKRFPEFQYKSQTGEMSMEEFKKIWRLEYGHRMWGRAIGLAFFGPAAFFWYRGKFGTMASKMRIGAAGGLLLFQGLLGWHMVKSGLDPSGNSNVDVPRVSHYRLAGHLTAAFLLYAILLRDGLSHLCPPVVSQTPLRLLRPLGHSTHGAVLATAIVGALVAGLDAGLVYNTWPKFERNWLPTELWSEKRKWAEDPALVQLVHRNLAYVTMGLIGATWLAGRRVPLTRKSRMVLHSLLLLGVGQMALGVATLVHMVPVSLAALHQNGAMALLTAAIWLTHQLKRMPK